MNRYNKFEKNAVLKNTALKTVVYVLLGIWALFVLFPFYWMILTSVKSYSSYNSEFIPEFFTLSPTFENYITAFTGVELGKYLVNAKSIMGIFSLDLTQPLNIIAYSDGSDGFLDEIAEYIYKPEENK